MKIKSADNAYIEKAKQLSRDEAESLFSRMKGRLTRRMDDKQLTPLDAIAIQLELEDIKLQEWRDRIAEIRRAAKD